MSYLVLARKWRPQTFAQVVGQQPVVRTLQNALARQRVAHAMLFSGVRGVGKTTLARLMAKALNCEADPAAGERPCNQCVSCREITAGSAMDLHEIDGASNRGIQEIRELKENIRFQPTRSRYKIIIIDEVHMLTTEAFNALLKTLEEPPAHVYFMFATTELHKIPITILSRCQRYELKRVRFSELVEFFRRVAAEEGVEITTAALEMVAREADGSIRDGLSLLDQLFSFGGERISEREVGEVLGLVGREVFAKLAEALLAGELERALALFDATYASGIDLRRFANELLHYFRCLMLCKTLRQPAALLDLPDQELAGLKELAEGYSAETLQQAFHLLFVGVEEVQRASRPRLAMEMTLIRVVQAEQVVPVSRILARLDQALAGAGPTGEAVAGPERKPAASSAPPEAVPVSPASSEPPPEPAGGQGSEVTAPGGKGAEQRKVRADWETFLAYVRERKPWMAHSLKLATRVDEEKGRLVIRFDDAADCKALMETEHVRLLTEFAQDFFQRELVARIQVRGSRREGAGDNGAEARKERRTLANDPLVQMAAEIFDGQVSGIRTGPRSR